jgi:hypothetical protein
MAPLYRHFRQLQLNTDRGPKRQMVGAPVRIRHISHRSWLIGLPALKAYRSGYRKATEVASDAEL